MNFLFTFIGYYLLSHFLHYLNFHCVRMLHAKSLQSCPTPWDPLDCSPPGSSVQARILKRVAISSSRGYFLPRDWTCGSCISCIDRQILNRWAAWEAPKAPKSKAQIRTSRKKRISFLAESPASRKQLPSLSSDVNRAPELWWAAKEGWHLRSRFALELVTITLSLTSPGGSKWQIRFKQSPQN